MAPSGFAQRRHTVYRPPDQPAGQADAECWQLWFDGCALPNPGRLGLGALVVAPDGRRFELSQPGSRHGCSNEAELEALRLALDLAYAEGARQVLVTGDSDFVVRHLKGEQQTSVDALRIRLQDIDAVLARFDAVEFRWVPRHRNRDADRLSRAALGLPDKPAPVPGRGRRR
ncbi:MAG: ribonuclease HI family protein [Methyloversatilis discipulorum]|nr:ribonuclease HI family protein [Methyloversatilis discipulorum]